MQNILLSSCADLLTLAGGWLRLDPNAKGRHMERERGQGDLLCSLQLMGFLNWELNLRTVMSIDVHIHVKVIVITLLHVNINNTFNEKELFSPPQ